jgi:hypothetical protein
LGKKKPALGGPCSELGRLLRLAALKTFDIRLRQTHHVGGLFA